MDGATGFGPRNYFREACGWDAWLRISGAYRIWQLKKHKCNSLVPPVKGLQALNPKSESLNPE